MKHHIHENGWTVILDDFNFATATQDDINQIACWLATNTLVVAHNQNHLTVDDELRIGGMFGNMFRHDAIVHLPVYKSVMVPGSDNQINRVTGELDEHGNPGLFGHVDDLDWHCNRPGIPTRKPLVWLLGIKGTVGSKTSWTNNILAYDDLTDDVKNNIKDLKMVCGWKKGNYSEFDFGKAKGGVTEDFNEVYTPNIVHTNNGGKTGLFFPFLQFRNFVGYTEQESIEMLAPLRDHLLQDKYCYHHDWQDGDVILSEQWLGIHKRWKFDGMPTRVLHRIEVDFANTDLSAIK